MSPARSVRGVQDLKTLAGKVGPTSSPSRAFLRIAVLEMEKERRGRERESALHRVKNIENRFGEIEAEKTALLDVVAQRGRPARPSPAAAPAPATGPSGQPREGVRIRY